MPTPDDRLEEILHEYGGLLRRAIERLAPGRSGVLADDVEQEARIRVWRALQSGTEITSPPSYLCRVALTATVDAIRTARSHREEPLEAARTGNEASTAEGPPSLNLSPEAEVLQKERFDVLRLAVDSLAEPRRSAVRLHLRGFRPDEVGRIMGWSPAKARNLAYRGLESLRSELRRREGNDGTAP
ncbi:MAG: sigma-70 family RNA polymerase sigma factor [Acidobacteria bacterium]|nr:sigma-70 family RNA polymerase sigma factor [Acidobacteriota bacterium]